MRISYDSEYDILYIKLGETEKVICKDVDEDITMDIDEKGRLVGIEILSASERVDLSLLLPIKVLSEALR